MWKEHPVKVAQDHSAIVAEDEYGVLIDLTLCAEAMWNNLREPQIDKSRHFFDSQKYRYIVWSKLQSYFAGVVEGPDEQLRLTLIGTGFQHAVTLESVIQVAAEEDAHWINASLDPMPEMKGPLDPEFLAEVKQRLLNVRKVNNPMAIFRMAEDALSVIEAFEAKSKL